MTTADTLGQGRESFGRGAWADAFARLSAADRETPLEPEDLERFATAAYLVGRDADSIDIWTRAHHEFLRRGEVPRAARCGFWLAFILLNKGELVRGGGWVARARRLLDDGQYDCVEQGYLLWGVAARSIFEGDNTSACATFARAAEIGDRFGDPDLVTLAWVGQCRALLRLGETAAGVALLDEMMVALETGEVSAIVAGDVYCSVIEGCQEIFDLGRAQAWTAALTHWCASQPDLVAYRGQCLVHRAEIMALHGAWPDAMEEAQRASERILKGSDHPAAGAAFYQQAELHRLRGESTKAEEAYRQASRLGREPQPGLSRLRLAQGQVDAAAAAIRRVVDEASDRVTRANLLAAHVEVMLAAHDVSAARVAADELSAIAADLGAPLLGAVAAHSRGAVLLSEGNPSAALAALRRAWMAWQELEAPYEAARVRVLLGLACREVGDQEGAEMELDAARWVFQQLGAVPDLARVEALSRKAAPKAAGGLTAREVQLLRLVAAGKTNRAIAAELVLSERTVDRHVSNIFTKLGVSSRAAATAYAYEHQLF
jgi:DNA-binding CsgD family transcriptional regulator